MNVLAFDTTLDVCSVALLDAAANSVLAERHLAMNRGHAEALHGLIGEVMNDAAIGFSEIDRIVVTTGPGTFTGTRIGIAAARGFALTLKVPVTGISTLQALAANEAGDGDGPILAALDARRGQVYAALYSQHLAELAAPVALDLEQVAEILPKGPVTAIGSGARLVAPAHDNIKLSVAEHLPRAAIWGFTAARIPADKTLPTPLYLRAPDAKPPAAGSIVARAPER